jgi:uncharacterized protein (AIM24 family)
VEERLAGTIVPVLSISLDPGESIVAQAGEFSWMSDSIQMTAGGVAGDGVAGDDPDLRHDGAATAPLSTFTARGGTGTISFACKLPGSMLAVDVGPGSEYLVHRHGFVAGTPDIEVRAGFRQAFSAGIYAAAGFGLQHVSGAGRAWIEFAGEVITFDLAAGESLRALPGHVGMFTTSVTFTLTRVPGIANRYFGPEAHHFAVLSGPGQVWLQSMPSPALTAGD